MFCVPMYYVILVNMSVLFFFNMNINLANRSILRNHCKLKKLLKSVCFTYTYRLGRWSVASEFCTFTNQQYTAFVPKGEKNLLHTRFFSVESGPPSNKVPELMPDTPKIVWPSLIKSIRNFILATFIIKPYLDKEFGLPDFVKGSKKAVEVVSRKLAEGDIKSLDGLVTKDIFPTLQKTLALMSLSQREQIAINAEDIYFSFPYQVGIIFNDDEDKDQKRFVEITMVFHSLRGLAAMRSRGEEPPLNMGALPEYQQRISICNYRFIREFTKGVDADWTINLLNHFRPVDDKSD